MKAAEIKQLLPIMQAFSEGRIIQIYANDMWIDLRPEQDVSFKANVCDYRIKPTKKEGFLIRFADGSMTARETRREADAIVTRANSPEKCRIIPITWEE